MDDFETIIDDTDVALNYSLGWSNNPDQSNAYNSTLMHTSLPGATVGINFSVIGQGGNISVYGSVFHMSNSTDGVHSSYSLDGFPPDYFNISTSGGGQMELQVPFYQSPPLSIGDHNLTVTYLPSDNGILYIDFFRIFHGPTSPSLPAAVSPSTSVRIAIGCTIGGVITIVLLVIFLKWLHRRKRPLSDAGIISQFQADGQVNANDNHGAFQAGPSEMKASEIRTQLTNSSSQGSQTADTVAPAPITDTNPRAPHEQHRHSELINQPRLPPDYATDSRPPSYDTTSRSGRSSKLRGEYTQRHITN